MLTHDEMVGLHADEYKLVDHGNYRNREQFVLALMQKFTYLKLSQLADNRSVLDLGCNSGYGSDILAHRASAVTGVDVSPKAIATAGKTYRDRGIDFRVIDGQSLPFEDGSFDFVVSCQVIEHVVDYKDYLEETRRVLTPTGIVAFTTPNALIRLDKGMKPWNKFHVREFSAPELQSTLSEYFAEVVVLGLSACEPLYSVEFDRVSRARKLARVADRDSYLRRVAATAIPAQLRGQIRGLLGMVGGERRQVAALQDKYGPEDFFYSDSNLESALDLLSLCGRQEAAAVAAAKQLR